MKEELSCGLIPQKETNPLNRQRSLQPVRYFCQHVVLVSFRTQLTGKLNERQARIIAVAVKDPAVQLLLHPFTDRLENESGESNQNHKGWGRNRLGVEHHKHHAIERSDNGQRRQRVNITLLEDD